MKRILNKILRKSYKDNRGLSLVEVLCAVAILALVTGVIGSVIVISTRTYRRGISETSIQQEAQLAANNIGNIVKDACGVIYGESNEFYVKNGVYNEDGSPKLTDEDGTVRVPDSTGNPKKQSDKFTELSIITNEKIQYTMTYDEEQKKLLYQEYSTVDGSSLRGPEVMATNVSDFKADTKDFENSKTIKLTMKVEDSDTNRDIPMEYTMTSRNGDGEGGEYVTNTDSVVIIFLEDDVVLVPGETYQIPLSVSGKLNEGGLEWESVTGLTAGALTMDYAEVTVPIDSAGGPASFTVRTKDKDGEGNPKDRKSCSVAIRKVTGVAVSHSIDNKDSQGGMLETAGTVYTFNANVTGTELAKRVAYAYDSNYKTAQAVVWSWELIVDGVTCKREWTCSQNADGKYEFAFTDTNPEKFEEYISVMTNKENAIVPQLILKIEEHMPSDFRLTVRATSKHALGVNKADSAYGDKDDPMYYGEDLVTPRETILNNGLEIILEPQEEGRVSLDMKGGLTSDVKFKHHGATDLYDPVNNTQGTWTTYDSSSDEAVITLGRDEKGSGPGGADPYTFTIDVLVSGVKKSTITVHVCRIDELSIEVVDNFQDKQGSTMALPTYDFRARLNVSNGKNDAAMQKAITYLIQYKEDGTPDSEVVKNTLSSRITWELIDYNGGSKVVSKDSVICMAGIGEGNTGEIIGSYTKTQEYYQVVNVKPARIEQKEDGTWYIKQVPEIDISPSAKTDTGLPANYELKVTIEAIHPLGMAENTKYNKTGQSYGVAESSASIKGELTIDTPTKLVIVEPGQGTNDSAQSDNEMVVPIEVHGGAVHSMEVTISGKSSKDTKLSSYTTEDANGNHNPYMSGNATSASQTRTWYMGLWIGENEKGNSNGRIQIHIDAYNSQGKVVASTDFDLGVRRVDSVDVKVADSKKLEDVNQEGITVKLEALPKGRGNNGTEFYDIQKDEKDNTYRWEQENHGEYKEPSPMEWKMVIKGTEKPLAEWTEYFEAGSIKTSVNESDHKATVEFALKQSLPSGTKIRAYSLHARGKVGETKYNKSGKKYGEVYGELTIGGDYVVADGFQRADDYDFASKSPFPNIRSFFTQSIYDSRQRTFFRYREAGTDWNSSNKQYHMMDGEDETKAPFSGDLGSRLFLPNKEYELEIVNVVYGTGPEGQKVIYWPQDEELLEAGNGWSEEGYKLWDGTWGHTEWGQIKDENGNVLKDEWGNDRWGYVDKFKEIYEEIKNTPQEPHKYLIPKTEISFAPIDNPSEWNETISEKVKTIGSETNPKKLSNYGSGNGVNYDKHFAVRLEPTSFNIDKTQLYFTAKIDKWENGGWVPMVSLKQDSSMDEATYKWFLQVSVPKFDIYHVRTDASGKYRVRSTVTGMTWTTITGGLFDTGSDRYQKYVVDNIDLFDMSDESGIMYLQLN